MMWIQSVLYFVFYGTGKPLEMLLNRGTGKTDSQVWETTLSWLLKDGAGLLILDPYGGEMALYNIQYYGFWSESGAAAVGERGWLDQRALRGMEPYVSKNPRGGAAAIIAVTGSLAVCRS
uniref:Uncharacterized protein n=1 Tax=Oryza meridionalis TaxID=40149 RepID=A0A0E0BXL3_9ORYZ